MHLNSLYKVLSMNQWQNPTQTKTQRTETQVNKIPGKNEHEELKEENGNICSVIAARVCKFDNQSF